MKQGSLTQFFQSNGPIHWQGKLLLDYSIPPHTQYLLAQLFLAQYVRAEMNVETSLLIVVFAQIIVKS